MWNALVLCLAAAPAPSSAPDLPAAQSRLRAALEKYWESNSNRKPTESGELVLTLYALSLDWQVPPGKPNDRPLPVPLHERNRKRFIETLKMLSRAEFVKDQQSYHVALDVMLATQLLPAAESLPDSADKEELIKLLKALWEIAHEKLSSHHGVIPGRAGVVGCVYTAVNNPTYVEDPSQLQFIALAYHATWTLRRAGWSMGGAGPDGEDAKSQTFWSSVHADLDKRLLKWVESRDALTSYGSEPRFSLSLATVNIWLLACCHAGAVNDSVRWPCTKGPLDATIPGTTKVLAEVMKWYGDQLHIQLSAKVEAPVNHVRPYFLYAFERIALTLNLVFIEHRIGNAEPILLNWYSDSITALLGAEKEMLDGLAKSEGAAAQAAGLTFICLAKVRNDRLAWVQLSMHEDGRHFHPLAMSEAVAGNPRIARAGLASESAPLRHDFGRERIRKAPILLLTEGTFPVEVLNDPHVLAEIRAHLADGGCLIVENAGLNLSKENADRFGQQLEDWLKARFAVELVAAKTARVPDLLKRQDVRVATTHGRTPNIICFDSPITCTLDNLCRGSVNTAQTQRPDKRKEALAVWAAILDWRTANSERDRFQPRLPWPGWVPAVSKVAAKPTSPATLQVGWYFASEPDPAWSTLSELLDALRETGISALDVDWYTPRPEPLAVYRDGDSLPSISRRLESILRSPNSGFDGTVAVRLAKLNANALADRTPYDLLWVCLDPGGGNGKRLAELLRAPARHVLLGGSVILEWHGNTGRMVIEDAWKDALQKAGNSMRPPRMITIGNSEAMKGVFNAEVVTVDVNNGLARAGVAYVRGGPSLLLAPAPDAEAWKTHDPEKANAPAGREELQRLIEMVLRASPQKKGKEE